jgi:hypothetical protein
MSAGLYAGRLVRHVVRDVSAVPSGLEPDGLRRGRLLVTEDGGGVASALVRRLADRGVAAKVASRVSADADGVVFLGGLREPAGPDEAMGVNREAFAAARTVAARFARRGGLFVTVQDTGGDFGLAGRQGDRAWLGGLAALARTVAREWPEVTAKAVDCERGGRSPGQIADVLAEELCGGGTLLDVGLRADGRRTTPVAEAERVPCPVTRWRTGSEDDVPIGLESVIVATGGARGITAAAVHAIARAHRPRFVLVGRTPLTDEPPRLRAAADEVAVRRALVAVRRGEGGPMPSPAEIGAQARRIVAAREIRRTIAALARAGSEVRYLPVDVRDTEALGRALDHVRREWGPVTGLLHGAGVLADAPLETKTAEMFEHVFGVKVEGLRSLLTVTRDDPLAFVYLFSSVTAQFGNAGQSDYAMANEVLFQVAAAEAVRCPDRRVTAVGWGPWKGGMVTGELAGRFEDGGVGLVPADDGGRAVLATLGAATPGRRLLVTADGVRLLPGLSRHRGTALRVGLDRLPELRDHAIGGTPVVPVALALDWFVAAARELDPAADEISLADLRVFQRVSVEPGRVRRLTLTAEDRADGTRLMVADERGRPCQAAKPVTVLSGERYVDWSPPDGLGPCPHADPYGSDALFHGPSFRALRSVDGVSDEGAVGTVAGVRELGWPDRRPHTDAAAVDGAFQLAVLWAERVLGGATLPMSVRLVRMAAGGAFPGLARCVVRGRRFGADHAVCDAALTEPCGRVHTELLGVTLIRRP